MSDPIQFTQASKITTLDIDTSSSSPQVGKSGIALGLIDLADTFIKNSLSIAAIIGINQVTQAHPQLSLLSISLLGGIIGVSAKIAFHNGIAQSIQKIQTNVFNNVTPISYRSPAFLLSVANLGIRYLGNFGLMWGALLAIATVLPPSQLTALGSSTEEIMNSLNKILIPLSLLGSAMISISRFEKENLTTLDPTAFYKNKLLKMGSFIGEILHGFSRPGLIFIFNSANGGKLTMPINHGTIGLIMRAIFFGTSALLSALHAILKFNHPTACKGIEIFGNMIEQMSLMMLLAFAPRGIMVSPNNAAHPLLTTALFFLIGSVIASPSLLISALSLNDSLTSSTNYQPLESSVNSDTALVDFDETKSD